MLFVTTCGTRLVAASSFRSAILCHYGSEPFATEALMLARLRPGPLRTRRVVLSVGILSVLVS